MALTGLIIGWRIRTNVVDAVVGFALVLLFGFGMIWFGVRRLVAAQCRGGQRIPVLDAVPAELPVQRSCPLGRCPRSCGSSPNGTRCPRSCRRCARVLGQRPGHARRRTAPATPGALNGDLVLALTAVFALFALRAYTRRTAD